MSRVRFNVTARIITDASAEHGDYESAEQIDGLTLREALKCLHETRTNHVGGVASIEGSRYSVTVFNSREYFTGAFEDRTLFIPSAVTKSSALRIARLAGAKS